MGHWELWCAVSFQKMIFFFKEGWWKGEEETRRKELRGSIYLDIILESWQWRRQYRVSLVERPEHIM